MRRLPAAPLVMSAAGGGETACTLVPPVHLYAANHSSQGANRSSQGANRSGPL